jgi:hypothetical protein
MIEIPRKLTRKELRSLKPGAWVAWRKTNWNTPDEEKFPFHEGQVIAQPVRSGHKVMVLFDGLAQAVHKNQLYEVIPITGVEQMHTQYDYNA